MTNRNRYAELVRKIEVLTKYENEVLHFGADSILHTSIGGCPMGTMEKGYFEHTIECLDKGTIADNKIGLDEQLTRYEMAMANKVKILACWPFIIKASEPFVYNEKTNRQVEWFKENGVEVMA